MADQGAVGRMVGPLNYSAAKFGVLAAPGSSNKVASASGAWGVRPATKAAPPGFGVWSTLAYVGPGRARTTAQAGKMVFTPIWWGSRPIGTLPYPEGQISGLVYQRTDAGDIPLANCKVRLYYRPNGAIAGDTVTNSQGKYKFDTLMPENRAYYAVALDPEGSPVQNAAIFDSLTPKFSIPILLQYTYAGGTQDVAFVAFRPTIYYATGVVTWTISDGTLPAGMTLNPATGVISGTPTTAADSKITVTVTDEEKRSASATFTLTVKGDVKRADILLGREGLSLLSGGLVDDASFALGDIGFSFELGGLNFQSNIYVGSNSYVTFGAGATDYNNLGAGKPGRGLLVSAADRSSSAVYAGAVEDGWRIRYEGNSGTAATNPQTHVWELTLYRDNTMVLVLGAITAGGTSMLSDGSTALVNYTPVSGMAYLFQKDSAGAWSIQPFTKSTAFNKQVSQLAPVSWFRMNEQSGLTLVDSGSRAVHGSFARDSSLFTDAPLTADKEGRGLKFTATNYNDFVDVRVPSSPIDPSQPFTISVIVKPTAKPVTPNDPVGTVVFMNNPGTSGGVGLDVVGTDQGYYFRLMRAGASLVFATDDVVIAYGKTTFVTLVFDGSTISLLLDGKQVRSAQVVYGYYAGMVRIGWADFNNDSRYGFIGTMDELLFFNKALTAAQIQALYSAAMAAPTVGAGDENTLTLLHFDGADQATTITDETGRPWTLWNGAKLTTSAKKFGSSSLQLSGKISGESNFSRAYSQLNENHTFGAEDFCVEIQAKQDQRTSAAVLACVDWEGSSQGTPWKAWAIVIAADGRPYCNFSNDGSYPIQIKSADVVPLGSFVHYAMAREGGLLRFFVNGALAGTADVTNLTMWKPVIGICLGTWPTAQADGLVGQLDEFRMTRGKAVYTSAFTPPTAAFPAYVPPTSTARPGAGYPLDGYRWFRQTDIQGPMMEARTLMIDFKVAQMPPEGDWSVLMHASYDNYGSPFIAVSRRQDLSYGDLGWYIRQGSQYGTQGNSGLTESNGNQVTSRRHRLLIVMKGTQPTNANYSDTTNTDYILDGRTVNADVVQSLLAMPDFIGRGTYGVPFIGNIYGVAIWKRTLTVAEQTRLWNDDSYDLAKYPGLLDAWLTRKVADGLVPNEVAGRPPLRLTTA